jgi:hypothetical protein
MGQVHPPLPGQLSRIGLSRRTLLLTAAASALTARTACGRDYSGGVPWRPDPSLGPDGFDPSKGFLTDPERRFVVAAVDRLIPADEFPSASQAGVVDFIDCQLAGGFGRATVTTCSGRS